jgi:thioredoxin reductase
MISNYVSNAEVVIIGAGPAGITAAIQLKRYGIPFVLLEKERVGGLLWNANLVENYPGFPAGVSGPKLIGLLEKQLERIGVEVSYDYVLRVAKNINKPKFQIQTQKTTFSTSQLIIAAGTRPVPIPLDIPENCQRKVFSEVRPLLEMHDMRIVVVGAGDAAFDYALNLVKKRNFVTIINRGGDVKCLGLLWERAIAEAAIEYRANTPVKAVELDEARGKLKVRTEAGASITADFLLFAIGRVPQTEFLSAEHMNRHTEGLYFVGDVKNGLYRQAAIAAGDGLRAAMDIYFKRTSEA